MVKLMENAIFGFSLTLIAGLSTMLGTIIIFFKNKNNKIIISSLSFASGVMISVSILELIPESFNLLNNIFPILGAILYILIFIVTGIIFSMSIDKYLPDKFQMKTNNNLYRVGIFAMLGIILHNIPEGIATFMATNKSVTLGLSLAISIALHNIPEGISISIPIYYATNSCFKALFYTFISGISEFLGALITYFFLSDFINERIMGFIFSLIAGIMLHISFTELLPTSKKYNKLHLTTIWFVLGVLFMIINHFIF